MWLYYYGNNSLASCSLHKIHNGSLQYTFKKYSLSVRCEKTRSYGAHTAHVRFPIVLNDPSKHRMSALQIYLIISCTGIVQCDDFPIFLTLEIQLELFYFIPIKNVLAYTFLVWFKAFSCDIWAKINMLWGKLFIISIYYS